MKRYFKSLRSKSSGALLSSESESMQGSSSPAITLPRQARCLFAHRPRDDHPDDLEFAKGEIITVLEITSDGWWYGCNAEGVEGTFPGAFCLLLDQASSPVRTELDVSEHSIDETRLKSEIDASLVTLRENIADMSSEEVEMRRNEIGARRMKAQEMLKLDLATFKGCQRLVLTLSASGASQDDMRHAIDELDAVKRRVLDLRILLRVMEAELSELDVSTRTTHVLFPHTSASPSQLSLAAGTACDVLSDGQWCTVRADGRVGQFPAAFLGERRNVSLPCVAVATHEYAARGPHDASLAPGCRVVVHRMHEASGWWEGEVAGGGLALFPGPFVRLLAQDEAREKAHGAAACGGEVFHATHDFEPMCSDDLPLSVGDPVVVLCRHASGWWTACADGKTGLVPANCIHV